MTSVLAVVTTCRSANKAVERTYCLVQLYRDVMAVPSFEPSNCAMQAAAARAFHVCWHPLTCLAAPMSFKSM